ncbi:MULTISPECIES: PadR family transcriptional regulator [Thermotoga]|jgi:DNA-binding PadR family transcriptional regulator|uniref:Transcription regulator PadR N-terminal domain-containing protein n=2 Tax=Thermotoga TaxID=2335 RepID=Q9WYC2_THEMA|nr:MULTISPECIES: PadR family transcriptional regulator [Thermotoga]HBU00812.1 PadR family transcriptional regulator [Thermotoga petrophila]AAD35374.1 conserved hypothetical protein [Thermotoga maritima MSB8]ABQ46646.1 transcriptional regulator, PadR family [Thermotoga petrophila RKU-1]ACB09004.1 transcriptional regulator, PadR-like family [Thermotoga sp. RQ2]AGL49210.1 Transcriptional regulator, PadR family [Thermotoga maritima MSB8]
MRDTKGHLKFLVLHIISQQPSHGYYIMKKISQIIGAEPPSPGALYPILSSLRKQKYIETYNEGKRKVYRLTDKGRKYLEEHKEEIKKALDFAERFRVFSEICGLSLRNVVDVIFKNAKDLTPEQKKKLKHATEDFERNVYNIIYGGKNSK